MRVSTRTATTAAAVALVMGALTGCVASAEDSASVAPGAPGARHENVPDVTATVPAPGGGSVAEVIEEAAPGPVQEVALDATAQLAGGVEVTVASAEKLDVTAETPGEVAGPAVAITLEVRNSGTEPISLDTAMVTVSGAAGAYGQATTSTPFAPFTGSLEAGASADGTYVFLLPADQRDSLSITVEYVAGAPIALFAGQINN